MRIRLKRTSLIPERGLTISYLKIIFSPTSALEPRFKYSTYLSMRVEDPVNRRDGLKLGPAFLSRWVLAGDLEPKSMLRLLAMITGISIYISSTYILFLTKLQKSAHQCQSQ